MKKNKLFLMLLAVIMILCVSIGPALAYFTAYTTAKGSATMALVPKTDITEPTANSGKKELVISNTGNAPCFVRVKAFASNGVTLSAEASGSWSSSGTDCWTYGPVLMPGAETSKLVITLGNLPENPEIGDNFNVAVVYEATPALWNDESGTYEFNWSKDVNDITVTD